MALIIDNRDTSFESQADDQQTLEASIDSLGLAPEDAQKLKERLNNNSAAEEEVQKLIQALIEAAPETRESLVLHLEKYPEAPIAAATQTIEILNQSINDDGLAQLGNTSPDLFQILTQITEDNPDNAAEVLSAFQTLVKDDTKSALALLTNLDSLYKLMNGEELKSAKQTETIGAYTDAPSPAAALLSDTQNLATLNSALPEGASQFTLEDLADFGLDSTQGNSDNAAEIAQIAKVLSDLDDSGELKDVNDIRSFITDYLAADGTDPVSAIEQIPQLNDSFAQLKAKLGLSENEPLAAGYQQEMMNRFTQAIADNNLEEAVSAELDNIDAAFPNGGNTELADIQSEVYQLSGYAKDPSLYPLGTQPEVGTYPNSAEGEDNNEVVTGAADDEEVEDTDADDETFDPASAENIEDTTIAIDNGALLDELRDPPAPENIPDRPGSADNSGSILKIPAPTKEDPQAVTEETVPSLSENPYAQYDDIKDSPLYSAYELENFFNGNTEQYAAYLAQAHYLLEEKMGVMPEDYDGTQDDPLSREDVKMFLMNRGYKETDVANEIGYQQHIKDFFSKQTDNAYTIVGKDGVADNNADFEHFNSAEYIRSNGTIYKTDVNLSYQRGNGFFIDLEVFPDWVAQDLKNANSGLDATVTMHSSEFRYNKLEQESEEGILEIIRPLGNQEGKNKVEWNEGDQERVRELEKKRLTYGNIQEYVESRTKIDGKAEGDQSLSNYYTDSGDLKIAYKENGEPLYNNDGKKMTVVEYEAIQKFASPDIAKDLIKQQSSTGDGIEPVTNFNISEATGFKEHSTNELKESLEGLRENFEFREVNIDAKKAADLALGTHEAASEEIANLGKKISTKVEQANSKLEKFVEISEKLIDLLVTRFETQTEMLKNLFQYLPI